jgi:hypothetical protein
VGIVLIVPPITEKLGEDRGVGKSNSETDGDTLPQFPGGWDDTHSEFLDGVSQEKGNSPYETAGGRTNSSPGLI